MPHVSQHPQLFSPYVSMYKKAQYKPHPAHATYFVPLSVKGYKSHIFTLRQEVLLLNLIYLINSFATGNLFFFFDQSFPPVNFNYLFSCFCCP